MYLSKLIFSFILVRVASAQTIPQVLASYTQLSKVAAYVSASQALSTQFTAADGYTFLAPSDAAIQTWLSGFTTAVPQAYLEATLQYHLLQGRYLTASIANSSTLIPTRLTNELFTNVTGGQRLEATNNGGVQFLSGAKAISRVVTKVCYLTLISGIVQQRSHSLGYCCKRWIYPHHR